MITCKTQYNLTNAKEYFNEHLKVGDYYSENESISGYWIGHGASMLGLQGEVLENDFLNMCEGLHPSGENFLTLSNKQAENPEAKRRIFYDFTLDPPKSVSIIGLLKDPIIIQEHEAAVQEALQELEKFVATRVRKNGSNSDRITGNMACAVFRHDTSRSLDPHIHSHCIIFNATFDKEENAWKSLQNYEILKAQKYIEECYYHRLSQGLIRLGYQIENNRTNFEIKGVSQDLIDRFSKRHFEIESLAASEVKNHKFFGNIKALKAIIAHKHRNRKIKDIEKSELMELWDSQITHDDDLNIRFIAPLNKFVSVEEVVKWAKNDLFERNTYTTVNKVLEKALHRARGSSILLNDIKEYLKRDTSFITKKESGSLLDIQSEITTLETLKKEYEIVQFAKKGRCACPILCKPQDLTSMSLSDEQKSAVEHLIYSEDFITLFRGGAGTGKSYTLQLVHKCLQKAGHTIQVLAPQAQQVEDLKKDGLESKTVSLFLKQKTLYPKSVIILDEAGQIGGSQMHQLLQLAKEKKCRVILSGDTKQHGSVEATDALKCIEKYAKLPCAVLKEIRRQDPEAAETEKQKKNIINYKKAVKLASQSLNAESFDILNKLGWITECSPEIKSKIIVNKYLSSIKKGNKTLIVSQTWDEIHNITDSLRKALIQEGYIKNPQKMNHFINKDLTKAQKQDPRYYESNDYIYFLKKYGNHKKGDLGKVVKTSDKYIYFQKEDKTFKIALKNADSLQILKKKQCSIGVGDRIQIKANIKLNKNIKLSNGQLLEVDGINKDSLCLKDDDGKKHSLGKNQHIFNFGYAITSYSSQGKTVDSILLDDSGNKNATSMNQWYVSISRGRKEVYVFTANKALLRKNIQTDSLSISALDKGFSKTRKKSFLKRITTRLQKIKKYYNQKRNNYALSTS